MATSPLSQKLGRAALRLCGWRIEGQLPDLDKYVAIGAHHTSNWDFVLFLAVKFALQMQVTWFGKHSIFFWPVGYLWRAWGGVPVERHHKRNMVDQAVALFRSRQQMALVISPEGTRKKVERWKTGFYHIATGAGVPIVCGALDFANRRVVLSEPFWPTGNQEADLSTLLAFFKPYVPKHPECAYNDV
ncbi:MAG: acyltransferase [Gammaproteobacteria bacterium HGW-Gammaproteobacteria-11]|nr:MAG: acyltransferase [Gammaproteobacteria bacterium HGW-Gammaproteobacteria-11]